MTRPEREREPEPVRRTAEIEEITNLHLIHPLASRLVPLFARMGLTPNAVSITGMLFGVLAGLAYHRFEDPRYAIAGFLLMIAWHVMDGADGQLARLTRSQSQFGKVLDGISDSVTFLAVYVGLALALGRRSGGGAYALVAVAAVCHAVQSAAYEVQRQEYDFWAWGRQSSRSPDPGGPARRASRPRGIERAFDVLDRLFYQGLSFPTARLTERLRTAMTAALAGQPERAADVRRRFREVFAPQLRRWSLLSANYRTLGIFIAALLGAPEYYFWFEIVGFGTLLAFLIRRQNHCLEELFATLDAPAVRLP